MKKAIFFLLGLGLLTGAGATISQKELKEGEYEIVIIQKGDTLWDLAGKYIGKCYQWPEFEEYNVFTDPHWIYPGERLAIGIKDGKLFMKRAEELEQELRQELERKDREIARLKEELESLKRIPPKEIVTFDESERLRYEEEKERLEKDFGVLKADTEALRREMNELARKLSMAEGLVERKDEMLSSEKQEKEKIKEALEQTQKEKEVIAKEETRQRRYKEVLAISTFLGVIIFNSLK